MTSHTGWLLPTGLNRGQDHLATRAVCEILYTALLPGITNVTDRARYYTLYPWVLWMMDQAAVPADPEQRTSWFRKADCLLTLVAMRHGRANEHMRAAVGSEALVKALNEAEQTGGPIELSRWASKEAQPGERYFAGARGGFGQYYQGPLEQLGVVALDQGKGLTWSKGLGHSFATAVDAASERDRFAACVHADIVTLDDLDALHSLCLCQLAERPSERDALLGLLWDDQHRRRSLGLILSLAEHRPTGCDLDVLTFRGTTATGFLPDGSAWELPDSLDATRRRWSIYQRSEWLSVAIQGLFWATLRQVQLSAEGERRSFGAFGDLAVDEFAAELEGRADLRFEDAVEQVRGGLPDDRSWRDESHEHHRALAVTNPRTPGQVARDSIALILALVARSPTAGAWTDGRLSPRQLEQYPVNLVTLAERRARWSGLPLREVLHDLVTTWGVRLHDRVALRKLRYQLNDTFQVRATEEGMLRVVGTPVPVFGRPRFNQAVQILEDAGALDRATRRPTALGRDLLGRVDG